MNNKINIAQIGVGYWGLNLLRNLVETKAALELLNNYLKSC